VILLDTHVLIWYLAGHPALPLLVKERIDNSPLVFVSAASVWELGIKGGIKGKAVRLRGEPLSSRQMLQEFIEECQRLGFRFLDIDHEACAIAPFFQSDHKDPFDRIIAAQSLVPEKLTVVSGDKAFDSFDPEITRFWQSEIPGTPKRAGKKKPRRAIP
jgi:PIN domain nuclease of toxin-antitoxin system